VPVDLPNLQGNFASSRHFILGRLFNFFELEGSDSSKKQIIKKTVEGAKHQTLRAKQGASDPLTVSATRT
jgi:hypothetical protein